MSSSSDATDVTAQQVEETADDVASERRKEWEGEGEGKEVEVAIIGNGPAAIFLSLLLSGYAPYYKGNHPDHFLHSKLTENSEKSLLDQDLEYLSDGLEGRSSNPVALLFDALMQPNQDIGETHPPSLSWVQRDERRVSHIVLGRGQAGGVWHRMQPDILSLSIGRWLQLPVFEYGAWERGGDGRGGGGDGGRLEGGEREGRGGRRIGGDGGLDEDSKRHRVQLGSVAKYYKDYVDVMGLLDNFVAGLEVTKVSMNCTKKSRSPSTHSSHASSVIVPPFLHTSLRSSTSSSPSPSASPSPSPSPSPPPDTIISKEFNSTCIGLLQPVLKENNICISNDHLRSSSSEINHTHASMHDYDSSEIHDQGTFIDSNLCEDLNESESDSDDTGISCCAKRMRLFSTDGHWIVRGKREGEEGEGKVIVTAKNIVLASGINDKPKRLGVPGEELTFVHHGLMDTQRSDHFSSGPVTSDPVLVVGAGLSAADTILGAMAMGLRVVHVFYQSPSHPRFVYHKMDPKMYSDYIGVFRLMQGKDRHANYTPLAEHRVLAFNPCHTCTVSNEKGRRTDIKISQAMVMIGGQAELDFLPECIVSRLGVKEKEPIDPKLNPMDVHPYSFESVTFPSIYAMGPLVGDNFVRFILGGALGVVQSIQKGLGKE